MTVEEYVFSVVEIAVLPATQKTSSAEDRAAAFEACLPASAVHRCCPITVSRENMYEGRDL